MNLRKFFFIAVFLLAGTALFSETTKNARLSAVVQYWNPDTQQLEFLVTVENQTENSIDLSLIILIRTNRGEDWRGILLPGVPARSSDLYKVSFSPDIIEQGDIVNISVNLYGKDYQGFIARSDKQIEIAALEVLPGDQLQLELTEPWPPKLIPYEEDFPLDLMRKLAYNLAWNRKFELEQQGIKAAELFLEIGPKRLAEVEIKKEEKKFLLLLTTVPATEARKVRIDAKISATFNEPVETDTVNSESFSIIQTTGKGAGSQVKGELEVEAKEIRFRPAKKLAYNTGYKVVASQELQSFLGNQLQELFSWSFRTQNMPKALVFGSKQEYLRPRRVYPPAKGSKILTDSRIQISFRSLLDSSTVNEKTFYVTSGKQKIAGRLKVRKNQIRFTPEEPLQYDSRYTITTTREIKNIKGKGLKRNVTWWFRTRVKIEYPESEDPNILIFSPSHDKVSYVLERKGVLKIGLTAFDPILHLDVNGEKIDVTADTKAEFNMPYHLKTKTTPFLITAFTRAGKSQKKFVVNFGKKPKPPKPPFQLIGILGFTSVDNLNNAPAGTAKVSATKAVLTIVPQVNLQLFEDSILRFKGILLREKYGKDEFQNKATSYSQLAVEWEELETFLGDLTAGLGWNFIRTNTSSFMGENDVAAETFFNFGTKLKQSKDTSWGLKLEYKNKNSTNKAANIDNETDAVAKSLKGKFKYKLLGIKHSGKLGYVDNDAIGKYQDFTSTSLGYKLAFPLGDFTPSLGYNYKQKKMKIENPSKGNVVPQYTSGKISFKIQYKLFAKTIISLDNKNNTQQSNIESSTYTGASTTLSLTQIF